MIKKVSLLLLIIFSLTALTYTNKIDQIVIAIKAGNAEELAKFFDNRIEITILDEEAIYSKAQAELVIKDFFTKYPPKSFQLVHNGTSSKGSEYAIGNLITTKQKFRTYFYIKKVGQTYYIEQLRFEKE